MDYDWKHESDPVTIIQKGRKEGVSMRIKDIRIRNFKSIREIHIPDIEQALILVGQNSTGKTAILDALRTAGGIYQVQPEDFREDFPNIEIMLTLTVEEEDLN